MIMQTVALIEPAPLHTIQKVNIDMNPGDISKVTEILN